MSDALMVQDLTVSLGGREILANVGFSLQGGALAALVGPNGSGKSTLLATLAGLHRPARGEVLIQGLSVFDQTQEARRRLGYMVAQDQLPGLLTPRQCLTLFAESRGLDRIPDSAGRKSSPTSDSVCRVGRWPPWSGPTAAARVRCWPRWRACIVQPGAKSSSRGCRSSINPRKPAGDWVTWWLRISSPAC